jgi:hypothetical protein
MAEYYRPYKPFSASEESSDYESSDGEFTSGSELLTDDGSYLPDPADLYRVSAAAGQGRAGTAGKTQNARFYAGNDFSPLDLSSGDLGVKPTGTATALGLPVGSTKFATNSQGVTSLLMVKSDDRDRKAFTYPTQFTIHLPRTYRNITGFSITQLKLLSAFLYFRADKYNTSFILGEEGRKLPGGAPFKHTVEIREGSYSIGSLYNELTIQMNTTPTFFYYPNGFNDFVQTFSTTGDLTLNFNAPGDYYYDSLLQQYIPNPTMNYIVTRYFSSATVNLTTFTYDQNLVAYYYPVLKEAVLDPDPAVIAAVNISTPDAQYVIYDFTGLDDTRVLALINSRLAFLDSYRTSKTFVYNPINRYTWGNDSFNNKTFVEALQLNKSIVSQVATQQSNYFVQSLATEGLTQAQYNALVAKTQRYATILTSMYNYLQTALASNFAINFGTYSLNELANPQQLYYIQNGTDVSGVYSSYSLDYLQARNSGQIRQPPDFAQKQTAPTPWAGYQTLANQPYTIINDSINNVPYLMNDSNIYAGAKAIDMSGYINTSLDIKTTGVNIVADVEPAKYTLFRFRSPSRQTVQVESLPRPFYYRYENYNSNFSGAVPFYFDTSYSWVDTTDGANPINLPDANYGASQTTQEENAQEYTLTLQAPYYIYQFTAPQPPQDLLDSAAVASKYSLNLSISTIGQARTTVQLGVYESRSALNADVAAGAVNALNAVIDISSATGNINTSLTVFSGRVYYLFVRSALKTFGNTTFKVYPYWSTNTIPKSIIDNLVGDPTQGLSLPFQDPIQALNAVSTNWNFVKTNDQDFMRLPVTEAIFKPEPTSEAFNQIYPIGAPAIGYDLSEVSNDLTDYRGWSAGKPFDPTADIRKDPVNLYTFQVETAYSASAQSYFYSGSSNAVLAPPLNDPYDVSAQKYPAREYKIVHWYDTHFMPPQAGESGYELAGMESLSKMQVYTDICGGLGLPFIADPNFGGSQTLQVGGFAGISFLPTQGWWDIKRFVFKSAYTGSAGPNDTIRYIGIFDAEAVLGRRIQTINLTAAAAVLEKTRVVTTPDTATSAARDGFDDNLGTWYEFVRSDTFPYVRHDIVDGGLAGTDIYPCTMINSARSFYIAVPFDAAYNVLSFFMMCGSLVPYPENSAAIAKPDYLGVTAPTGQKVVVPSATITPATYIKNIYQSQYEQSLPIGTQVMYYKGAMDPFRDSGAVLQYALTSVASPDFSIRGVGSYGIVLGPVAPLVTNAYKAEVYLKRGIGTSGREVYFKAALTIPQPVGETILSWTANSDRGYVLTQIGTTSDCRIYSFGLDDYTVTLPVTPVAAFTPWIPSADISGSGGKVLELNIATTRLLVDNSGNFAVSDEQDIFLGVTGQTVYGTIRGYGAAYDMNSAGLGYVYSLGLGGQMIRETRFAWSSETVYTSGGQTYGIYTTTTYTIAVGGPAIKISARPALKAGESGLPLYLLSDAFLNKWLAVTGIQGSEAILEVSRASVSGSGWSGVTWYSGGDGSIWFLTAGAQPQLQGNAAGTDAGMELKPLWNIFYPTMKVGLYKRANVFNQITNLTEINYENASKYYTNTAVDKPPYGKAGPNYPEYGHSQLFFYSTFTDFMKDVSGAAGWRWGAESNYTYSDTKFQGFYFNSYMYNLVVDRSPDVSGRALEPDDYYYVALRGYSPDERYQTLLRFNCTNRYDYGIVNSTNLINEISGAKAALATYNPSYSQLLGAFDSNFTQYNPVVAGIPLPNLDGSGVIKSFSGFKDYYNYFTGLYGMYNASNAVISTIKNTVDNNLAQWMSNYYGGIIPADNLARARYTDAIKFDMLWTSSIAQQIQGNTQEWGLGWNLGYDRMDLCGATIYRAGSFYKILDDYIYLRMNEVQNMNKMDTTSREDLSRTLEPQGQIQQYSAKLLLAPFGQYATSLIYNPVQFNPPLGKLDKLSFTWTDSAGNVLSNIDAEWSAVLNITEMLDVATAGSSLARLPPPA